MLSLVKYTKNKAYSNIELNSAIEKNEFTGLDRTFFTRLFYGVIEKIITIDYYISKVSDRDIKSIGIYTLNILRMGIYQIRYMDRVPNSASCNESVVLAKRYDGKSSGFVNAVLRNFIRKMVEIEESVNYLDEISKFEIKYSCSGAIINLWTDSYGIETTKKILKSLEKQPHMTIAVNSLKITRDEYAGYIEKNLNVDARITEVSGRGLTFLDDIPARSLYGFDEGLFYVQDEASQICAMETEAKEGDLVIDCCAAPGGKSFYMAQMMNNRGKIISFDLHKNKLRLIEDAAKRLGIDIIETIERDARKAFGKCGEYEGKADVVLCDVPCSGLGVASKKPEIKYKSVSDIAGLTDVQLKILSTCSSYVKCGGLLIYSTCTLNRAENEEIAERFLRENSNFRCVDFVNIRSPRTGIKTFFPFEQEIDGFFLVKMRRFSV